MPNPRILDPNMLGDEFGAERTRRPLTVWSAVVSLPFSVRRDLAENHFGKPESMLTDKEIVDSIIATNTVGSFCDESHDAADEQEVWIDEDGEYTITVFDSPHT